MSAFTTASVPDSNPIFKWDGMPGLPRNPVSAFIYNGGSVPINWNLKPYNWTTVTAITLQPSAWQEKEVGHKLDSGSENYLCILLDGAREATPSNLAIFPDDVRSDLLHSIRKFIEAHSRTNNLEGCEEATACGVLIGEGSVAMYLRVTEKDENVREYTIDRWK